MLSKDIGVEAFWDEEAQVWVASSEDVPGLITEADTMEHLMQKLKILIPELLQANGLLDKPGSGRHPKCPISPKEGGFEMINLEFDSMVFQEGNTYVAYSPKLDVSSCGGTVDEARNNLKTAVRLFLEEAEKMGTLEDILSESGYEKAGFGDWLTPRLIATELMSVHG